MALVSGRFRLDPRDAEPVRAPAPAPLPVARPAPPRPPPPAPAPAPAAGKSRRMLLVGAAAAALLLLGGAVAVYVATTPGYPDDYVLARGEYPSGMSLARLSADDMDQLGIRRNPGEIDAAELDSYETDDGVRPERGYAQVIETADGGRVVALALAYPSEDDVQERAREARALCSFASAAVLRDGKILVLIIPEDGASRTAVRAVTAALRDKTSDLAPVCGAA